MATHKTTKRCLNCGHNHPEAVTRCGACGAAAGHDPAPKPEPVATPKAAKTSKAKTTKADAKPVETPAAIDETPI